MSLIGRYFLSTDPGAPTLSGLAGSLTNLLDAILVDGYGSGTDAKAGLGWNRVHMDVNQRVYQNDPVLGSGKFLHVDDSGSGAAGPREALLRCYHSWSGSGGLLPFPTVAEVATGIAWGKSASNDAVARDWVAVGNGVSVYLFIAAYSANFMPWNAGDFCSYRPGDTSNFILGGGRTAALGTGIKTDCLSPSTRMADSFSNINGNNAGNYIGSDAANVLSSKLVRYVRSAAVGGTDSRAYGYFTGRPYPGPVSGGLDLARCVFAEGNFMERGHALGVYQPLHDRPLNNLQLYPGAGPSGVDLLPVDYTNITTNQTGQVLFEIGAEW